MVVIILQKAPQALRGQLTRWMLEPAPGVYVGRVTARVREQLWLRVSRQIGGGTAVLVHRSQNEQGFRVETIGQTKRTPVDFDGFQLFELPTISEP